MIGCDFIAVIYEKSIPWVISTTYKGKHVINTIHVLYILKSSVLYKILPKYCEFVCINLIEIMYMHDCICGSLIKHSNCLLIQIKISICHFISLTS